MSATSLRVGLATARFAPTLADGVRRVEAFLRDAGSRRVDIVCFPESYLPGLRGVGFDVPPYDHAAQEDALAAVSAAARAAGVAAVVPMDWEIDGRLHTVAFVIDADGATLGYQTKNQVDPTEEGCYTPGSTRRVFDVRGTRIGVAICHEGWRYPETVRWAAARGARVVFHPHYGGSDAPGGGPTPRHWGDPAASFHEKAMLARAAENTVYFASVNYALRFPETATAVVGPDGACVAHAPYGEESLLVADLDLAAATGFLASRYAPERYAEAPAPAPAPVRAR